MPVILESQFAFPSERVSIAPDWHYGFSRFGAEVSNLTDVFREIADNFIEGLEAQFESEGAFGGHRWRPVTETHARRKARLTGSSSTLVFTGQFRAQVTNPRVVVTRGRNMEITLNVSGESNHPDDPDPNLLHHHQFGTRHMVARPVIVVTDEQKYYWVKLYQRHFIRQLRSREGYRYR